MRRAAFIAIGLSVLALSACHKRKRLTESDFDFRISPPASTLVKGSTVTLTAVAGSAEVNPTWSVSGVGTLSSDIGRQVDFSSDQLGDTTITAIYDGVATNAQIAVVSYNPTALNPNRFDIYDEGFFQYETSLTDAGNGFLVDNGPKPESNISPQTSGYTPQGVTYFRLHDANVGSGFAFWFVNVAGTKDLSAFALGSVKFDIRVQPALGPTANIRMEVSDGTNQRGVTLDGTMGFSRLSTDWQEITIPVLSLSSQMPFNLATIKGAFVLVLNSVPASTTFDVDVDAIRWEK
jgi:hypothetical protein